MSGMFFEGGFVFIIEQMDVECFSSGNSMNDFEQFLFFDSDFSWRVVMFVFGKFENGLFLFFCVVLI